MLSHALVTLEGSSVVKFRTIGAHAPKKPQGPGELRPKAASNPSVRVPGGLARLLILVESAV